MKVEKWGTMGFTPEQVTDQDSTDTGRGKYNALAELIGDTTYLRPAATDSP